MNLTRRGIMAMLGMGAAAPGIGVKAAASAMGAKEILTTNVPVSEVFADEGGFFDKWYGSLPQISLHASREARSKYEATRYAHMKSWGAGFRHSVIRREILAEEMFEKKLSKEEGFLKKVFEIVGQ